MILNIIRILCIAQIFSSILFLSYCQQEYVPFHDWRRVVLITYSYFIIVFSIMMMIWLGKRSLLLLFLFPTMLYIIIFLPNVVAMMINIIFLHKDINNNMHITKDIKDAMIAMQYITIVLLIGLLIVTIVFPTYINNLILAIYKVTAVVPLFRQESIKQTDAMATIPPQMQQGVKKIWDPVRNVTQQKTTERGKSAKADDTR